MYLTNEEASTGLFPVVKHAGSGRAGKKSRENTLPLHNCFTPEQSTVKAFLFVL